MELQDFQQVLLNTLSEDKETREQAENILKEIKTQDYSTFLSLALQSIDNPANKRIPPISITHIYREAKSQNIFKDESILERFLQNFASNLTSQLLSPNIEDQFKIMLSSILSILHVFVYKESEDVTIPTYILTTYNEMPNLRPYLMNCVYEIAFADPDLGGFNFEDLLTILLDDLQNQSLFIPRIHLFFALAKTKSDLEIFHEMFESLIIEPMSAPEYSSIIMKSIANFSDINGYFFTDHSLQLFEKLVMISLNQEQESDIRSLAIFCIVSIVRNAPEMCKSIDHFYDNIIAPLVLIVSEISDDDQMDYNPNDNSPWQNALDAIGTIDETIGSRDGIGIIFQMYQAILNPDAMGEADASLLNSFKDGAESWQAKYAVISSLSSMMNPFCNEQIISGLFELIIPLINEQTHPKIRIAIYKFIKNATKFTQNAQDISPIIDVTIQSALAEDTKIAQQNAFKAIASYFKNLIVLRNTSFVSEKFFTPYFSRFLDELRTQPPEINKYIVQCVGLMAKAAKGNFDHTYFEQTTQIFSELLHQSEDLSFNAKIIFSYSICLFHADPEDLHAIEQICCDFLQAALQIYGNDGINEEEAQDLTTAICSFLAKVGKSAAPLINSCLPRVIQTAQKAIQIEESQTLEGIYGLISMYTQIPSKDSSVKLYASRNDVIEVKQALQILRAIIKSIPCDIKFIQQVMNIAKQWICSNFLIEDLVFYSLKTLHTIVKKNWKNVENIDFYLQCYVEIMDNYIHFIVLWKIYKKTSHVLLYAKKANWRNSELFEIFLKKLPGVIDHAILLKLNTTEAMHTYNNYDYQDKRLAFINLVLTFINEMIAYSYEIFPEMSLQFVSSEILPKIQEYLQNYELLSFSVTFINKYYIALQPEIDQICEFTQFLINIILSITRDATKNETTELLLENLGDLLYKFDFKDNPKFADYLVNFFNHYLSYVIDSANEEEEEEADDNKEEKIDKKEEINDSKSDNGNVAFAKFLLTNLKNTSDPAKSVDIWYECKPLWCEIIYDSAYYYQFLVYLIQQKTILEELKIYWPRDFLPKILNDVDENYYGKQNLKIIAEYLREELETKEGRECLEEIFIGNDIYKEDEKMKRISIYREHLEQLLNYANIE